MSPTDRLDPADRTDHLSLAEPTDRLDPADPTSPTSPAHDGGT
ncbi:hypothetical protein ACFV2V_09640 [Streptomyces sp. NPDC059698]|nr:hypothetical protein [Streptomyces sp. CB02366]